jgi:transposase
MSENQPTEEKSGGTAPANENNRGKRYSKAEVSEIIAFINDHNTKNKRGGQKVASEKFGVSAVTISRWMNLDGKKSADNPSKKPAKRGRKPGTKNARKKSTVSRAKGSVTAGKDPAATLARLGQIYQQIEALQTEYDALKKSL